MAIAQQVGPYIVMENGHITKSKEKRKIEVPKELLTPLPELPDTENLMDLVEWNRKCVETEEIRRIQEYKYMRARKAELRKIAFLYYKQKAREILFKTLGYKTRE